MSHGQLVNTASSHFSVPTANAQERNHTVVACRCDHTFATIQRNAVEYLPLTTSSRPFTYIGSSHLTRCSRDRGEEDMLTPINTGSTTKCFRDQRRHGACAIAYSVTTWDKDSAGPLRNKTADEHHACP